MKATNKIEIRLNTHHDIGMHFTPKSHVIGIFSDIFSGASYTEVS